MTALQRLFKQIIYLIIFFSVPILLVSLFVWPYLLSITTPAPTSMPLPDPVIVEQIDFIRHGNEVDIVARLRNPNPRAGIPSYDLIFVLRDKEQRELDRISTSTYLLPGSVRYVTLLGTLVDYDFDSITVDTPTKPEFTAVPTTDIIPLFNSFLQTRKQVTRGGIELEAQAGVITNRGSLGYRRVDLTGVSFDAAGKVVGVGTTFIDNLEVGQQRTFQIEWPTPPTATQRVIIFTTTNIFDSSNIMPVSDGTSNLR